MALLCLGLAACGAVPRGAGFEAEVLAAADSEIPTADPALAAAAQAAAADFAVVPVTRINLPALARWPRTGPGGYDWIRGGPAEVSALLIRPGDLLSVTIWDTEENSLLAGPGGRVAQLQDMRVGDGGTIFLPFIGTLRVAGMTEATARTRIEERYIETIPSAQVQLSMTPGRASTANLVGGVSAPGVYPLEDRGVTLLSLLSLGGGVRPGMENPQVRLFRGSQAYGISLSRLYDDPGLDTVLAGGDRVIVEEEERFFLSLGAAGTEAMHVFPGDRVTALQAMAIIGGVAETRADPQGVLVLREYPSSMTGAGGPPQERVVFTIDLTSADGLFSARNFEILPGDLVYVTESPLNATQTVLSVIGSIFGLAGRL